MQIQMWDVSQAETIIHFNRKCFLTDLWKPEDWRELPADPMAIYYGAVNMDTGALAVNLFIYNRQGEQDYIKIMNPGCIRTEGKGWRTGCRHMQPGRWRLWA